MHERVKVRSEEKRPKTIEYIERERRVTSKDKRESSERKESAK